MRTRVRGEIEAVVGMVICLKVQRGTTCVSVTDIEGEWGSLLVDLGDEVKKLGHDGGEGLKINNGKTGWKCPIVDSKEGESEIRAADRI